MPSFIPVDHDPFAAGPPDSASDPTPAPDAPISFSSGSGGGGLQFIPIDHDPFAGQSDRDAPAADAGEARPLTIHGGRQAPPAPATVAADGTPAPRPSLASIADSSAMLPDGFSPSPAAGRATPAVPSEDVARPPSPAPKSAGISYEDAVTPPSPNPGGALSNGSDDGYLSGTAKGVGTTLLKGLSDVPGVFGNAMDMADYFAARAQAKITGRPADDVLKEWADAKAASAANPSWTRYLDPRNVLPSGQEVAAPVLAKTGEYVPTSEPGRLAMAAGEAAIGGALTPGMGGIRGMLPNAIAGTAGQGATDLTGDPLYGMGAGLAAAPAAEAAAAGTARLAGPMVQGVRVLDKAPVVGPAIQNAVDRKATGLVLGASSDPAALRQWAAAPPAPDLVPGSPNTLAAAVGTDQGLLEAEKAARNVKVPTGEGGQPAPTYFNAVDAAKSNAQLGAIQGVQPSGDVMRPGQVLGARMDAIDAAAQAAVDRLQAAHQEAAAGRASASQAYADQQTGDLATRTADRASAATDAQQQADAQRQVQHDALVQSFQGVQDRQLSAAQDAAAPLGDRVGADDLGSTLRSAVEEVRSGAKDLHRGLYKAVDPDGTLALVATPVGDRASSIMDGLRANGAELTPSEAPLFRRAATLPDVATYGTLHALDTDLSAAMSTERRASGESPAWARLTQLKGAVKDAMTGAADNQAAHEARLVQAGRMAPEDTIMARLGAKADEWDAAAQQPQAWAKTGTGGPTDTTAGTVSFRGSPGADISSGRGPRNAPGGEGLSPTAGRNAVPSAFPREVGVGPRPDAPFHDPDAMPKAPPSPGVPRPETLAGFIRRNGGIQDAGGDLASMGLHNLMAKPGRGLPADRMREAAAEAGYLGADTARAVAETTPNDLLNRLEDGGHGHSVHDENAAAQWADYDESKVAYDRQQANSEGRSKLGVTQPSAPLSSYSVDDIYGPDGLPLPGVSRSGLSPNFDKGADNRLKAANAAYAQYAQTYKNPIVGPGLRTTGYAGQYQRSDANFIKGAVKPGAEGYENARAYLRAAANDPAAIGAMHEAALNPLRKAVTGNGTLSPRALASWREGFGPALRALDEVSPGFSSSFDDAAGAAQALVDLGAQHKAALEGHQAEAAAEALAGKKAGAVGLKAANAADIASVRAGIAGRVADDRAANTQSKAETAAGVAQAKGMLAEAKSSPAGAFAGKAAGAVSPAEVENAIGGFLKTGTEGVARMRGLVQSVANDPDALAGLQKAGVNWMVREFVNDGTGELSPAKFISFLRDNRDVLRELYPHDQVSMLGAVARDAEAGIRWRTSTAVKGGSDSEKNRQAAFAKAGETAKHVSLGMVAMEALTDAMHGDVRRALAGGGAAATAYLLNTLRSAGIKRTTDLYRELLADPEKARAFIAKMPASPESGALHQVARLMKRSLMVWPVVASAPPRP